MNNFIMFNFFEKSTKQKTGPRILGMETLYIFSRPGEADLDIKVS